MKIEIQRLYLLNLLEKASTVSGSSAISPFLRSFLLEVEPYHDVGKGEDSRMFNVLRTDRVLGVVAHTDAFTVLEDKEPYRVLIHADKFLNLVRNLESESVVINVPDGYSVQIEADSFKANWMAFDISQFPDLPRCLSTKDMLKIKSADFIKAVERVRYASGKDSVQSNFKQVFFDESGCWAWDGFTYQQVDFETEKPFAIPLEAIDVVKFARISGVEDMYVGVSPESLHFVVGLDIFVAQNPNVKAPNTSVLDKLRKKSPGFFVVEVAQLRKLIKRIGITSDNNRIAVDVRDKSVTVSGKDDLDNKSNESVPIKFEGDVAKLNRFSLNWEFLDKALTSIESKTVKISVETSHIILEGEDSYGVLSML